MQKPSSNSSGNSETIRVAKKVLIRLGALASPGLTLVNMAFGAANAIRKCCEVKAEGSDTNKNQLSSPDLATIHVPTKPVSPQDAGDDLELKRISSAQHAQTLNQVRHDNYALFWSQRRIDEKEELIKDLRNQNFGKTGEPVHLQYNHYVAMTKIESFMNCQGERNFTHKKQIAETLRAAYNPSEQTELFNKAKDFAKKLMTSSSPKAYQEVLSANLTLDDFLESLDQYDEDTQKEGASHHLLVINSLIYILFGNYDGSSYLGPKKNQDDDKDKNWMLDFPESENSQYFQEWHAKVEQLDHSLDGVCIGKFKEAFENLLKYRNGHEVNLIVPDRGCEGSRIYTFKDIQKSWSSVREDQETVQKSLSKFGFSDISKYGPHWGKQNLFNPFESRHDKGGDGRENLAPGRSNELRWREQSEQSNASGPDLGTVVKQSKGNDKRKTSTWNRRYNKGQEGRSDASNWRNTSPIPASPTPQCRQPVHSSD